MQEKIVIIYSPWIEQIWARFKCWEKVATKNDSFFLEEWLQGSMEMLVEEHPVRERKMLKEPNSQSDNWLQSHSIQELLHFYSTPFRT